VTSAPQPAPQPAPPAGDDDLRLVLFGRPAAGKSSLLGALAHLAQAHPEQLGGRLDDLSGGLAELARHLYERLPDPTPREVVPYPVRFQPLGPGGRPAGPAFEAVLLDCDGSVANRMLRDHETLSVDSPEGTLAYEVSEGDTLLLVLDASKPPASLEAEFNEFGRFLEAMRKTRGEQVEVAGLPVFLVLTKCDLLAAPGDSAAAWMDRIEGRKRDADARFRAFLGATKPDAQARVDSAFGRLDLHVWATAIKRPALASGPESREPYGVAELFRQALTTAQQYRGRYDRSERRLTGMVVASGLLVGIMATLSVLLYYFNLTTRAAELQRRVEEYRFQDRDSPGERLKGSPDRLRSRQLLLQSFRDDEVFRRLPAELRVFVEDRLEELKSYIPYLEKVLAEPHPATETTEEGLDKLIDRLRNELAPPRSGWEDTPAGVFRRGRLETAESLRKALQAVRNWYLDGSDRADRLWTFADYPAGDLDWSEWAAAVEKLLERMRKPPFRDTEPVPGVPGGGVTFRTVMRFDRVADARTSWDFDRARLTRLLNLATAVGLAPAAPERPAVLVVGGGFKLADAKPRVAQLKSAYPDYEKSFVRNDLPEAFLPRLRAAARRQYEHLLEPGRAEVLRQLRAGGRGEETPARWEAVRGWLRQPEELLSWRELARVVSRLIEGGAPDPVTALQEFLARGQFDLKIQSLTVEIPELRGLRPRAEARLVVQHSGSSRQPALAFEPAGEPTLDSARRVRAYTYRLAEGKGIVYKPGDSLWAELPLAGSKERLVWSQSRSALYQFERLRMPPRLQSSAATSLDEGRLLDDVRLVPRPEDGVPAVPDLMPWVKP
jgi:hypothetical protein